jgi:hypothetical protein
MPAFALAWLCSSRNLHCGVIRILRCRGAIVRHRLLRWRAKHRPSIGRQVHERVAVGLQDIMQLADVRDCGKIVRRRWSFHASDRLCRYHSRSALPRLTFRMSLIWPEFKSLRSALVWIASAVVMSHLIAESSMISGNCSRYRNWLTPCYCSEDPRYQFVNENKAPCLRLTPGAACIFKIVSLRYLCSIPHVFAAGD